MTRDEHIVEANRKINSELRPLLDGSLENANSENWWDIRTQLVEIEYQCHMIIGEFDRARIEEEIESGIRQRFIPKEPNNDKKNFDYPSLEDLGL